MENKKPFLTQYCNLAFEWQSTGITIDTATESQVLFLQDLKQKALKQSGLTENELSLISLCRKRGLFKQVNTYARRLKEV
ncbi:MAG: hypothetical protein FWC00_04345 [Firmicutes bacterium]|nr:hypothetical protein [Bacillota bacterium]